MAIWDEIIFQWFENSILFPLFRFFEKFVIQKIFSSKYIFVIKELTYSIKQFANTFG